MKKGNGNLNLKDNGSIGISGELKIQAYIIASLNRKKLTFLKPLNEALNALILALKILQMHLYFCFQRSLILFDSIVQ